MWIWKKEKKTEKEEDLLKKLCGNDEKLYGLLSKSLYLHPRVSIPKTDLKILVEEAEKGVGVKDYREAMAKYRRALDKAIFEAAQNPRETSRHAKVIRDLALKNVEVIAKAKEKGEKTGFRSPSLEGRIRYYKSLSTRSEDVIRIASLFYNEILEESDAKARAQAQKEMRAKRRDAEAAKERRETEAKDRRKARSRGRTGFSKLAIVLLLACIMLVGALAAVLINYTQTVSTNDSQMSSLNSQIDTLKNQTIQLHSWLDGNVSVLNAMMNTTGYTNVTFEPPWKVQFFKGFELSWTNQNYMVASTPQWEPYCGGYSKAIIYMQLTNMSPSLNGSRITFFLNYIMWYGSTHGGNDFIGTTILSENNLSVTMPGSVDPQSGPLEVKTLGPYVTFQFGVDTAYTGNAWATFDLSVYFRD